MESKWYENIPENGVLINIKDNDFNEVILFKPIHKERFSDDELEGCTPITAAEWWDFAPWQDMKDAPLYELISVKWINGTVSTVTLDDNPVPLNIMGWLPLPAGDL